jgi:hypothetical protein
MMILTQQMSCFLFFTDMEQQYQENKARVVHQIKLLNVLNHIKNLKYYKREFNMCDYVHVIQLRDLRDLDFEYYDKHYNRIEYYPKHYSRRDDERAGYENYYLEEEVEEDYPRNQLLLYKRYVRILEQKIKQLETKDV